jgi:hypothetical protein
MLARIRASSSDFYGGPFGVSAEATILNSTSRLESVSVSRFQLGRNNLGMELTNPAPGRYELAVRGRELDIAGLLRLAAPFISNAPSAPVEVRAAAPRTSRKESASKPHAPPGAPAEATKASPSFPELRATVAIDAVDLGGGHTVRDLTLSTRIVDDLPQELSLHGLANGTNLLDLAIAPNGDRQSVKLTIADATGWLQLLLQPFREVALPASTVTVLADNLGRIPVLFSGGRLELAGDLRLRTPARLFDGQFKLADTVIRQPPRVLRLVALKSGKRLRENPLIKEISASRLFISDRLVALEGIKSDGASLAYLNLNFLRYGLADEALHLDGRFAGVGFEVLGTRAEPQVFLKNNLLIRSIGVPQEFAFGDAPVAAPPPPSRD